MKKLLLSLALLVWGTNSFAQELEFGLKAGLSSSNVGLSDYKTLDLNVDNNTTFNFGAYGRFKIVAIGLFVQPEVIVNRRAGNFKIDNAGTDIVFSHSASYIDVPVLIGFKFLKAFRVYAGPNFQFLTKQKTDFPTSDINFTASNLKSKTTGIQAGFGLDLARLRLDFKYDVNNSSMGSPFTYKGISPTATSGMFTVQVGFKLFGIL